MDNIVTLESLIERGVIIQGELIPNKVSRLGYNINDRTEYETWKNDVKRFLITKYPNDISLADYNEATEGFERYTYPRTFDRILGVLYSVKNIPEIAKLPSAESSGEKQGSPAVIFNNSNSQSQSQQQSQSIDLKIIVEAITDQLTGKQVKELKQILQESDENDDTKKTKLLDKIKSFGIDVGANILANIIASPIIASLL